MSVYACSDFHGNMKFYRAVVDFLKPEDKVYFLGDAGDRGPEPWETIKAIAQDSQFIYLKGNHEDMLVDALKDAIQHDYMGGWRLLASNGGSDTFDQAMAEEDTLGWANWLNARPTLEKYVNAEGKTIYLSHAGFTPWLKEDGSIKIPNPHGDKLIWDRNHFYDNDSWGPWSDAIIVHGHTPIPCLWDDLEVPEEAQEMGAFWYADGRKVCIDTGAHWTGHTVLLDLDTWDEHIFTD